MIDNFEIVRDNLLKFDKQGEFYMILVLRRRKDVKGKVVEGVNEDNRLIKHFFVYDKEYFDRKKDAIVALCNQNNARAYILPQRRSHDIVMWALHNKTGEVLKSGAKNTHFDHLIRSCVAGIHEVPPDARWHKRWVIDIDADDETIEKMAVEFTHKQRLAVAALSKFIRDKIIMALVSIRKLSGYENLPQFRKYYPKEVVEYADTHLDYDFRPKEATDYMPDSNSNYTVSDITLLDTPHGFHIVTPPFNKEEKAMKKYFGFAIPGSWIKPDAMALLYAPDTI